MRRHLSPLFPAAATPSQEDKARTIWGQISTGLGKTCCLQLGFMVPSSCPKVPPHIATRFVLALLWSLKKFDCVKYPIGPFEKDVRIGGGGG